MKKFTIAVSISLLIAVLIFSCSTDNTPVYQLTTSAEPTEAGTITQSTSEVDEGETITITANANEHWVFDRWSGDYTGSENPASIVMDQYKTITAIFKKRDYLLTINIEGEGTVDEKVIQQKTTDYPHGTLVELTANPEQGWRFIEWGGHVERDETTIQITVEGETNLTATFERIEYPLTITIEGEGTVEQEVVQSKTTEHPFETVVQLTPIPSDGWNFVEWGGDVGGNDKPLQITIDGEKNVTVKFSPIVFLAENGITIMCPDAEVGDFGVVNGEEYEVVDNNLLTQRIEDGKGSLSGNVCVSLVTNMRNLFRGLNFNQSIENWDVSNVTDMSNMFQESQFNQSIGEWNVSKVNRMNSTFRDSPFNQPIGNWDVSNVTSMGLMFTNTPFNQPIGEWDVSNVTMMGSMFQQSSFNQPIETWDTENVTYMNGMFAGSPFNQNISNWCVWRIGSEPNGFSSNLQENFKPVWGACPD